MFSKPVTGKPQGTSLYPCRKDNIKCCVPDCNVSMRKDNLKSRHYNHLVKFLIDGSPMSTSNKLFETLTDNQKTHTRYFFEHNISQSETPSFKRPLAPITVNPFSLAKKTRPERSEDFKRSEDLESSEKLESPEPFENSENLEKTENFEISENISNENEKLVMNYQVCIDDISQEIQADRNSCENKIELEDVHISINKDKTISTELNSYITDGNEKTIGSDNQVTDQEKDQATNSQFGLNNTSLIDTIVTQILEKLSNRLGVSIPGEYDFSTEVARKVTESLKYNNMEENFQTEYPPEWIETDKKFVCNSCALESKRFDVPKALKTFKRGNFGIVSKETPKEKQAQSKKGHQAIPLHIWCFKQSEYKKKLKLAVKEDDKKAATMIVTNVIYCVKNSHSSVEYKKLCDKDQLLPEVNFAKQNDGQQMFFEIKDLIYDELTERIVKIIEDVDDLAVTLDKVTIGSKSYTVVVTYYFYNGAIHCLLNKLYIMGSKDGDGESTAEFLVMTLMETLRMTKAVLSTKLKHIAYDGVYELSEERTRGGGGLSLIDHVADVLGVEKRSLSGHWDMGHKLQLVFSDVLPKDKSFSSDEKFMFDLMSEVKKFKDGMRFEELAEELMHPVLTPQGRRQNTRWVRSMLRCLETFLRDLPTIYALLEKKEQRATAEMRHTDQKVIKNKIKKITDGKFISRVIGYCQILNYYAKASLNSQNVKNFPTTVLASVEDEAKVLEDAGKNFEFESQELFFAGIGSPDLLITNLKQGFFKPHVTDRAKQKRAGKLNIERRHRREVLSNLGGCDNLDELHDTLHWRHITEDVLAEDIVIGEVPIKEFTDNDLGKVKEDLRKICESLSINLDDRLRKSDLMKSAQHTLTGSFDWYIPHQYSTDQEQVTNPAQERLSDLAEKMGIEWQEMFNENTVELLYGYVAWINLCIERRQSNSCESDENLWQIYYKSTVMLIIKYVLYKRFSVSN